ncbi:TetR/AcrR family transcriptional regulator [bacterium]|nr:MAG: TetR/AcrR family transcriptional regulator [bacterium]
MKSTRKQAAQNRERILDVAANLFREKGFDGVGVADVMKSAGLTHGGFYGHFASKEDLIAQASARALTDSLNHWKQICDNTEDAEPLSTILSRYLSDNHRDSVGTGCAIAALGPEVARQGTSVRHAVTQGTRALLDLLTGLVPGKSQAVKREKALATYASMVGAMVLARAVDDAELSDEILRAVSNSTSS